MVDVYVLQSCCTSPSHVSLATSLPCSLIITPLPSSYHSMSHSPESNMPSPIAPGYATHSVQGRALRIGRIVFERFWIKQTSPYKTCFIEGVSHQYIPAQACEGFFRQAGRATLVRREYEEIWERLKSDVNGGGLRGMLVWGSSGAGNSCCIDLL